MKRNMNTLASYMSGRYMATGMAGLVLLASGCGDKKETDKTPTKTVQERPGPSGKTSQEFATSIAKISKSVRGEKTVPSTFCKETNANPQRVYSKDPAKLIVNTLCQPPLGAPSSLYEDSTFKSDKVGKVKDGDVVEALCVDPNGQTTTNVTGGKSASDTWVKVSHEGTDGFISEVNLGYVEDSNFDKC